MAHKFRLGRVVATPDALDAMTPLEPTTFLNRHARGDWGEVCADDAAINEQALIDGDRLMSVYTVQSGETIWLITEADRSATTFLLPSNY